MFCWNPATPVHWGPVMNRTLEKALLDWKSRHGSFPEVLMLLHFSRRADTAGPLKETLSPRTQRKLKSSDGLLMADLAPEPERLNYKSSAKTEFLYIVFLQNWMRNSWMLGWIDNHWKDSR